jgi:hypothetical protein
LIHVTRSRDTRAGDMDLFDARQRELAAIQA